ncbi:SdrD B-like domain-containing protein [Microlunatus spumicola]
MTVTVFPSPEMPFWPGLGESPEQAANLGSMPGSVVLRANITNTGSETLRDFSVTTRLAQSTTSSNVSCDYNPEGVQLPPGDGPVLLPGLFAQCFGLGLSGVTDDAVADLVTTATARGADTGTLITVVKHYYAIAQDDSDKVGDLVWLDADRDGVHDDGESGIAGVRLTIAGPDGKPATNLYQQDQVIEPQTTDAEGHYLFKHLRPIADGERYTVTVDPDSSALQGLQPTLSGVGSAATDSSTGSGQSSEWMGGTGSQDTSVDFGFVTASTPPPVDPPAPGKAPVALTADASPEPATIGSTIKITGSVRRAGQPYKAPTVLEFRPDGADAYAPLKKVKSSSRGTLTGSVKASVSGTFRYRFAGDDTTEAGVAAGDHVEVRKASVALTVAAPASATKGKTIKVVGSVTREGKKYKTSTVLEFRADGDAAYAKVKTVRSNSKGKLSTGVKANASGTFRYRYAGSSANAAAASTGDHVAVKPKPPSKPKPKAYKNCMALTRVYPHGVGRTGAKDKGGSVADFTRDTKAYTLNKKSDRDKDGIACER